MKTVSLYLSIFFQSGTIPLGVIEILSSGYWGKLNFASRKHPHIHIYVEAKQLQAFDLEATRPKTTCHM